MDEAASKLRMEINSKPEELDEVERKIMQLEIEREAIKRENDNQKEKAIKKEIANLSEIKSSLLAKWEAEKNHVDAIQQAKQEMEELKLQAEQAERNGDFGTVAEIRYGKLNMRRNPDRNRGRKNGHRSGNIKNVSLGKTLIFVRIVIGN